jgi:hypothetical protein
MPVKFKKARITIPAGTGARSIPGTVRFDSRVVNSEFVLAGFRFNFLSKDHHIDEVEINFVRLGTTQPDDTAVHFLTECRYQDKNADDKWDGRVDVVVVAEVE